MDVPEPEQTPFNAVQVQTSKIARVSLKLLLGRPRGEYKTKRDRLTIYSCYIAIPSIPRPIDALHCIPMDWYRGFARSLLPTNCHRSRMVHRFVSPNENHPSNPEKRTFIDVNFLRR